MYERFGRRLSSDGYVVGAFEASEAAEAAAWLREQEAVPRVLAGSDAGAAAALRLAATGIDVDGVVIAGLPVGAAEKEQTDAAARTACPIHLGVLADDSSRARTTAEPVAVPDAAALASIRVPVLAVHGGADPVAPFAAARAAFAAVPTIELVETVGGLHDAFNDQSHRSVAAHIVLWLERLRGAGVETPIARTVAL